MFRKNRSSLAVAAALVGAAAAGMYMMALLRAPGARRPVSGRCERIVSLAPNLTEILFELGLGGRIVGVTRFCAYPPEAARLPRVGGFFDASIEAIVSLAPDLVVLLRSHERLRESLEELGIDCLQVGHETLDEILSSIELIGSRCAAQDSAGALREKLERRLREVRELTREMPRPSVLVVVSRDYLSAPAGIWAAGRATFYDQLLDAAGGRNVIVSGVPPYAQLSREGLLRLDPEVIIEIIGGADARGLRAEEIAADWRSLDRLRAVGAGRVIVMAQDYAAVPGPRLLLLLEELVAALHPQLMPPAAERRAEETP